MNADRGVATRSPGHDVSPRPGSTIHLVGVGGAGMSAIASVLRSMGYVVTGSDLKASAVTERLRLSDVTVIIGHRAENVGSADQVGYSTAVPMDNPELLEARAKGLPVLTRADLLSLIASHRRVLAVAGTHGKTTTTSMAALAMVEAGLNPSFMIGGDANEIGTNAVWDVGDWLVVEADESDGTFLRLSPEVAVLNNVEPDHIDFYGSLDALHRAFEEFCSAAPRLVVGADDPVARELGAAFGADLVGFHPDSSHKITVVSRERTATKFDLTSAGELVAQISLAVPGLHNVRNAAVSAVAAWRAGAGWDAIAGALSRFTGVARRFEFRGEAGGVHFVDDYAHLPGEVSAVLEAAHDGGWQRVVVVLQPHRYSRTAAAGVELGQSLASADVVVVTDVYPAGESPMPGVSGRLVADSARRHSDPPSAGSGESRVTFVEHRADVAQVVADMLRPGDLCLTLGAGDLTSLADEIKDLIHRWA